MINQNQAPLTAKRIHVCHIGGRFGWSDNPIGCLEKDVFFTLFDADEESIKDDNLHFGSSHNINNSRYRFIAQCVSGKKETRYFNITYDPATSSLFNFNPNLKDFITNSGGFNYDLKRATQTITKKKVECLSLDIIFSKEAFLPDLLSLDVEGAEYEVLTGSNKLLSSSILGVRTEVVFVEFRKGQKTFTDIFSYLIKKGFFYAGIENGYSMHYASSLDYARGIGFPFASDAFFIKDYKKIIILNITDSEKVISLMKLAAIGLCFNLLDYSYQILHYIHSHYKTELYKTNFNAKYIGLCINYYKEYHQEMNKNYPLQKYYALNEEMWAPKVTNNTTSPKKINGKRMLIVIVRKFIKKSYRKQIWRLFKKIIIPLRKIHLKIMPMNNIEKILFDYGLKEQAKLQKLSRNKFLFEPKKLVKI